MELDAFLGRQYGVGEPSGELVDIGAPVDFPSAAMRVAERSRRLRPQRAMRDPARRAGFGLPHRRRIAQPAVESGPTTALPLLGVQLTEPLTRNAVAAAGHPAALVGLLPMPPGIGGCGEHVQIRSAFVDPPQTMTLTQPVPAAVAPASAHPAGPGAKHRIVGAEIHFVGTELRPHNRHQRAKQPDRLGELGGVWRRHHDTCRPVNQPACSITSRASSTVR